MLTFFVQFSTVGRGKPLAECRYHNFLVMGAPNLDFAKALVSSHMRNVPEHLCGFTGSRLIATDEDFLSLAGMEVTILFYN